MNREMLNGSGIKDPVPYRAIKNIGPQAGEVYKSGRTMLLVVNGSQNGMYCPVLKILAERPFDAEENPDRWTELTVGDDTYYTDVSMVVYSTTNSLKHYLFSVEDMESVKDRIADAFGIRVKVEAPVKEEQVPELTYKRLYEDIIDKLVRGGDSRK